MAQRCGQSMRISPRAGRVYGQLIVRLRAIAAALRRTCAAAERDGRRPACSSSHCCVPSTRRPWQRWTAQRAIPDLRHVPDLGQTGPFVNRAPPRAIAMRAADPLRPSADHPGCAAVGKLAAVRDARRAVPTLVTVGGESHAQFESIPALRPALRGYDSNRLDAPGRDADHARRLEARLCRRAARPRRPSAVRRCRAPAREDAEECAAPAPARRAVSGRALSSTSTASLTRTSAA